MTMAGRVPSTIKTVFIVIVAALLLTALFAGCKDEPVEGQAPVPTPDPEALEAPPAAEEPAPAADDTQADAQPTEGGSAEVAAADQTVIKIKTNKGEMVAELYDEEMPITAGSFLLLVEEGFYDGLTFHRVVPDFVIQGGDPNGDGTGGPGFAIPLESPGKVHHERGILSMARSQALDSAGSQFFVCLSNNESVQALDSLAGGYAAFGKVTAGMDVADTIRVGDRIESVEVVSTSAHAEAARSAAKAARLAG